jgi:hypothetical protein
MFHVQYIDIHFLIYIICVTDIYNLDQINNESTIAKNIFALAKTCHKNTMSFAIQRARARAGC